MYLRFKKKKRERYIKEFETEDVTEARVQTLHEISSIRAFLSSHLDCNLTNRESRLKKRACCTASCWSLH